MFYPDLWATEYRAFIFNSDSATAMICVELQNDLDNEEINYGRTRFHEIAT